MKSSKSVFERILDAAEKDKGMRLTWEDVWILAGHEGIKASAQQEKEARKQQYLEEREALRRHKLSVMRHNASQVKVRKKR